MTPAAPDHITPRVRKRRAEHGRQAWPPSAAEPACREPPPVSNRPCWIGAEFIPHSLRHLYASTALAEGIPITEVSRWLGHKSIEVTHQIYGHLVPSSFDRARAILDVASRKKR